MGRKALYISAFRPINTGKGRGRLVHGPGRLWPWPRRPGVREVMRLRDERRGACAFVHEVRVSRDEDPWDVTVRPVFFMRRGRAFVACSRIGAQATNATRRPPAKGAGTHED